MRIKFNDHPELQKLREQYKQDLLAYIVSGQFQCPVCGKPHTLKSHQARSCINTARAELLNDVHYTNKFIYLLIDDRLFEYRFPAFEAIGVIEITKLMQPGTPSWKSFDAVNDDLTHFKLQFNTRQEVLSYIAMRAQEPFNAMNYWLTWPRRRRGGPIEVLGYLQEKVEQYVVFGNNEEQSSWIIDELDGEFKNKILQEGLVCVQFDDHDNVVTRIKIVTVEGRLAEPAYLEVNTIAVDAKSYITKKEHAIITPEKEAGTWEMARELYLSTTCKKTEKIKIIEHQGDKCNCQLQF
jgi:hypothetical protein